MRISVEDTYTEMIKLSKQLRSCKSQLNKELSKIDREISDIQHIIEFKNFNASEGYRYAKELKLAQMKRREIKNEIILVDDGLNMLPKVETIKKTYNNSKSKIHHQTYRPKVRKDLQFAFDKINTNKVEYMEVY